MIKLAADELVVREASGGYGTLDRRRLLDDLWAACADAGLHDPDLPSDVADVVTDYATHHDPTPTAEELDALAARLLGDCGLHEAARCWCARRERRALPALGEQVPVEAAAIRARLAADRFYPEALDAAFVARVQEALGSLGLRSCTAMMLRETARHLWLRDRDTEAAMVPPAPGEPANYWLIRPGDWASILPADRLTWLRTGTMRPHPVSCLLPRIHIDLDLRRLLDSHAGAVALGDLLLIPALDDLLRATVEVIERIADTLASRIDPADQRRMAVGVTVFGVVAYEQAVAEEALPLADHLRRSLSAVRTVAVDLR